MKKSYLSFELHSSYLYLFVIVLIATCLRLYHLTYQSLWYDELHSVVGTHPASDIFSVIEYSKSDQPPAFFILLHYWFKIFTYNEFYARLLAALIGVAGVVAVFFLGKELNNSRTGLMASFITALNWFHLYFSQEVRFYGLLFLLTSLSYLYFIRCNKTTNRVNLLLYIFTSVALIYTHYYGMVVLLSQLIIFLWLIISGKTDRKTIIYSIIAAATIILSFIPWMPTVLQDNDITNYWAEMPSYDFLIIYYFIYLGHNKFLILLFGLLGLYLLIRTWFTKKESNTQPGSWSTRKVFIFLTFWLTLSYLIPLVYTFVRMPMLHERYTIIALPAIFILVSMGFNYVNNFALRALLIVAITISTIHNFTQVTHYYTAISKNQYREVVKTVIDINNKSDFTDSVKIYSDQARHYNFYFEILGAPNRAIHTFGRNFNDELANTKQVWVLKGLADEGVDNSQQNYLNQHFVLTKSIQFVGAEARLYTKKEALVLTE